MDSVLTRLIIIIIIVITLSGCDKNNVANTNIGTEKMNKKISETVDIDKQGNQNNQKGNEEEKTEVSKTAMLGDDKSIIVNQVNKIEIPSLPIKAKTITEFIPEGWVLLDSVELDFNKDSYIDIVGVLEWEASENTNFDIAECPRILFAAYNCKDENFVLSFQDINLIRNRSEGGVYGDPYLPLTTDGYNFTTNTYGGSAWKWSESHTFEYRNDEWYLVKLEESYGYGPFVTSYVYDDYESKVGKRCCNSDSFEDIENREMDSKNYDLTFDISLGEAPTLSDYSERWILAQDRLNELKVKKVWTADSINITESKVSDVFNLAKEINSIGYTDKSYIAYTFTSEDKKEEYLAIYDRNTCTLNVVSKLERLESDWVNKFDNIIIYQNRIYYTGYISEDVSYTDSEGLTDVSNEIVSTYICSMNMDGSNEKKIYNFENKIDDIENVPYISIGFEIHKDKILMYTYGDKKTTYYRMNIDGSNVEYLGNINN